MNVRSAPDCLQALERLVLPAPPQARPAAAGAPGPPRLAWRVFQSPQGVRVEALEALPATRGWRAGDRLPAIRLPEPGKPGWGELGEAERRAVKALKAQGLVPRGARPGFPEAVLAALEGHSRVLWAEGPGSADRPVLLVRELCALEVRATAGGFHLALTLPPGKEAACLRAEGDRLLHTRFSGLHRGLAALLDPVGQVDARDRGRLAAQLARLAPHLPLLTDLLPDPAPAPVPERPGLLAWMRGGWEHLDLMLRVQPGPGLSWQLPGQGARLAVAGPPAQRRLWTRDLPGEAALAARIEGNLPPSARPTGPFAWRIEGPEAVATLLADLRDLGEALVPGGVPGLMPAWPRRLEEGVCRLDIQPAKEGLELRGQVLGEPLERILPALKGAGRFLTLTDGSLLDLSGLLGVKLRAWAQWGTRLRGRWVMPAATHAVVAGEAARPEGLPEGFQGTLRPYQMEGFAWMASRLDAGLGACLADDMGLGKTVQTAALLLHRAGEGPSLVLAPTSVVPNWRSELARFTPALRVFQLDGDRAATVDALGPGDVLLASYGLLGEASLQTKAWGSVVLDEAHAIKNPDTRRAQISRGLQAKGRLALTGTPVENRAGELASLLTWLLPGLEDRFQNADAEELRSLAAPFLLRRRKDQVLPELPPRTDLVLKVDLGEEERAFHEALLQEGRAQALAGDTVHLLALLMRLRRACGHPALVDPAYRGPGAKLDLLFERLALVRDGGRQALVFSQFTGLLDLVQARLRAEGFTYGRLDGTMAAAKRGEAVARFQAGDSAIFLVSLRAGGTGLNLTAADEVFHLDPWWNPAVEDQASDRAHRIGRTRAVTVYRLVAAGSVEERVLALHERKRALVEALLEGRDEAVTLDRATLEGLLAV